MTLKTIFHAAAVTILGASLAASPVLAKNFCSPGRNLAKGCKNEIKQCGTDNCTGKTGKDRRLCLRGCRTSVKTACRADSTVCTGSASGAFLR